MPETAKDVQGSGGARETGASNGSMIAAARSRSSSAERAGARRVSSGDAEEGSECRMPGSPAVEAEDEFVKVGLEVPEFVPLAAQPVADAQGPDLEVV